MMNRYNLVLAFRNMMRHKGYTAINITGLSIGFLCTIFIALWIKYETSYDQFHEHSSGIYRVYTDTKFSDNKLKVPYTPFPMGETMKNAIPEIKTYVRIVPTQNRAVQVGDKTFYEDHFVVSDSTFFDVFSVEFISGSPDIALNEPNKVVITQEMAGKYFGNTDPLGKTLVLNNSDSTIVEVSAVVKSFPDNSHFTFDFLCSIYTFPIRGEDIWLNASCVTYFLMNTPVNKEVIEKKMEQIAYEHVAPQIKDFFGFSAEEFSGKGNYYHLNLEQIKDIHLHSDLQYELSATGDIQTVYIFLAVAILILIIASINFTNLSTAKYSKRIIEIGIKKTVGAERRSLILQFISESVALTLIALFFSLILAELLIPLFNNVFNTNMQFLSMHNLDIFLMIVGAAIVVGILAGLYPAIFLSSFSPARVLKGSLRLRQRQFSLRNVLVVFQFVMSFLVILGTFIITKQLAFIQQKELGFDTDKVIVIERTDPIHLEVQSFIDEVQSLASVENVALTSGIPGRNVGISSFSVKGRPLSETYLLSTFRANENFIPATGLKIVDGRNFSANLISDSMAVLINETAAKELGMKNPVGKEIVTPGPVDQRATFNIVGVVKDFHYRSLHEKIAPLLIISSANYYDGFVTIRLAGGDFETAIHDITDIWNTFAPGFPMVSFFFDNEFEKLYASEKQISRILGFFAFVSIFIACLGLLGLASYTTERKTKEIGIRKAIGANERNIVYLLSQGFLKWVVIAIVIATPVAIIWSEQWLQRFAYKAATPWWIYLLAGLFTLVIAQLSVMYQSLKAALKNPIKALRYE